MKAQVTVRFSHVDPAGIVFYVRYFEMLSRAFPEGPLASTPFAMQTEFMRPNRLGDRLLITHQHDKDGWSYFGRLDGVEHFRVVSLQGAELTLTGAEHRIASGDVLARPEPVGAWATDASGRMSLPRYFERVSETVELWIEKTFGKSFRDLHIVGGIGMPTVRFTTRCRDLPRVDDEITMLMQPVRLGTKSVTFRSWLVRAEECLVENDQVIVFVKMRADSYDSIAIPGALRSRISERLADSGNT